MAKLQQFQENWSGGTLNPGSWTNGFNTGQIAITNNRMVITLTAGLTNYCGYDTPLGSLIDSYFTCQCVDAGNQSLTSLEVFPLQLLLDTNNIIRIMITGGTVYAQKKVSGGAHTSVATIAYDSTAMQYFRVRETGGSVYWDYGPDGVSWTNLGSETVANLFSISNLYQEPNAGTWAAEASTTTVTFGDFNFFRNNRPGNIGTFIKVGNGVSRSESIS